jgi:hypothetical protein
MFNAFGIARPLSQFRIDSRSTPISDATDWRDNFIRLRALKSLSVKST